MAQPLLEDVQQAIAIRACLEAADSTVTSLSKSDCRFYGAKCYDLISKSLTFELAIVLARLFDAGARRRHPNHQKTASLPLLLRLLRQRRCQKFLTARIHPWFSNAPELGRLFPTSCSRAISEALNLYQQSMKSKQAQRALRSLKYFRDKQLAHNDFDASGDMRPTYAELFILADIAQEVLTPTIFAIDGSQYRFRTFADYWKNEAGHFWTRALVKCK
jgi:AbiU2